MNIGAMRLNAASVADIVVAGDSPRRERVDTHVVETTIRIVAFVSGEGHAAVTECAIG